MGEEDSTDEFVRTAFRPEGGDGTQPPMTALNRMPERPPITGQNPSLGDIPELAMPSDQFQRTPTKPYDVPAAGESADATRHRSDHVTAEYTIIPEPAAWLRDAEELGASGIERPAKVSWDLLLSHLARLLMTIERTAHRGMLELLDSKGKELAQIPVEGGRVGLGWSLDGKPLFNAKAAYEAARSEPLLSQALNIASVKGCTPAKFLLDAGLQNLQSLRPFFLEQLVWAALKLTPRLVRSDFRPRLNLRVSKSQLSLTFPALDLYLMAAAKVRALEPDLASRVFSEVREFAETAVLMAPASAARPYGLPLEVYPATDTRLTDVFRAVVELAKKNEMADVLDPVSLVRMSRESLSVVVRGARRTLFFVCPVDKLTSVHGMISRLANIETIDDVQRERGCE